MLLQGASMLDGSAILKPALARGTLRCLGCSSPDKFKKTIEKDPGLERRFQQVSTRDVLCLTRSLASGLTGHQQLKQVQDDH